MDGGDWQHRLAAMIATLRSLTPIEFYDEETSRYHGVEKEIGAFSRAFVKDRERLAPVLATKPVATKCWLPLNPRDCATMDVMELYWRLGENYADERFVDSALEEPFRTGALVAALERIAGELHTFIPDRD